MSVPVYKRGENKLQALVDTIEMCNYIIGMCENEKIFPKKTRWTLCQRLLDNCIRAVVSIRQANKVKVETEEDFKFRKSLQQDVLVYFEAIWAILTIACSQYPISKEKIHIASNKLLQAETTVTAWINSDDKRYKEQLNLKD